MCPYLFMVQRLITSAQLPRKVSAEAAYKSLPSLCTPSTDFEGYALREHRLCTRCHDCRAKSTRYGSCRLSDWPQRTSAKVKDSRRN